MKKWKVVVLSIIIALIVIASHIGTSFGIGAFLCDFALSRYETQMSQNLAEGNQASSQKFILELEWLSEVENKSTVNITNDGLKLVAVQILNVMPTNKWAVLVHGYRGGIIDMSNYAKHFYEQGYNILIPNLRAHGESEGTYIGMGWHDRLDLISWIDMLVTREPSCEIALLGISMGATTIMMATGEELPENVKVAIADCGYSSVYEEFEHILEHYVNFRKFPLMNTAEYYTKKRAGLDFSEASAVSQLKNSTTPTLFVHGSADDFVPFSMLDKVYYAATGLVEGDTKEKLVIDGAEHAKAASVMPELYWEKVFDFVNKHIA